MLSINGQVELVVQDKASREQLLALVDRLETIEGIRRGLESFERGEGRPTEEVFAELRRKYNLPAEEEQQRRGEPHAPVDFAIPPLIERSQNAFLRDLPELLKKHRGKWVAYRGDERLGFGSSKSQLCQSCLRAGIKPDEFVVRWIEPDAEREVEFSPEIESSGDV